ncbi:MAG: type II toxin-antitoxin system VapC family toxin [Deferrisomatales bacterium]
MKLLLDTHAFLWWVADDPRLVASARALVADPDNELFLSAASGWEISIKCRIAKLSLAEAPGVFVPRHLRANAVQPLPVRMEHALRVSSLPLLHRDPFDRLLVAQSQVERIPLVTGDPLVAQYPVDVRW